MKGRLIREQTTIRKIISCKGQGTVNIFVVFYCWKQARQRIAITGTDRAAELTKRAEREAVRPPTHY